MTAANKHLIHHAPMRSRYAQKPPIIPLVFGKGERAYNAAKRQLESNNPEISPDDYTKACRLLARRAGI